jgi:hypothetical protein
VSSFQCARKRSRSIALFAAITLVLAAAVAVVSPRSALAAGTVTYSATQTIPVPPASTYAGSGGGDGWAVALSSGAVYNVFHHSSSLTVACHQQSDASACWSPETITDSNGHQFATSGHPGLWLDQSTGKLYVFATRDDSTAGVVCVDTTQAATNSDPFCGFTALTAVGDAPDSGISGLSEPALIGTKWYAFNYVSGAPASGDQNALLCFDVSAKAACASQPFAVSFGAGNISAGTYPEPQMAAIGGHIMVTATVSAGGQLSCFDPSAGHTCSGAWPVTLAASYASSYGAPFPLLSSTGSVQGLCLPTGSDPCYDLSGASVATPSGMTGAIPASSGWNGQAFVLGPRVYVPNGNANAVDCYDASTNASCTNFPKTLSNLGLLYTVNADPQRPTCIWVNSDDGSDQIQNFDAYTGGACGQGPIRVLASSFVVPTTACQPTSYTSLQVTSPAPGTYTTGTVSFEDSDANQLSGVPDKPLDAAGTADLSSLNLSTSAGLPQFLITLTGAQGSPGAVTVKLTWTGTDDPSCVLPGTTVSQTGTSTTENPGGPWSGYVAKGDFSSSTVHARVILPQITCNTAGMVSMWVGYDGYITNDTVEQDGVNVTCSRANAAPSFALWYELFKQSLHGIESIRGKPAFSYVSKLVYETDVVKSLSAKLKAGDAIDMFVARIPPDRFHGIPLGRDSIYFSLIVSNSAHTQIGSWSKTVEEAPLFSPQYSYSECIVESPNGGAQAVPKFDTITFQGCSAIDSGKPLTRLYLTRNNHTLDSIDNYTRNAAGLNQFLVHWLRSQ